MEKNLDQKNIVKFYDWYQIKNTTSLVFELLDISLSQYMEQHNENRLPLNEIRFIIKEVRMQRHIDKLDGLSVFKHSETILLLILYLQLAVALNALKSARVIHSDIKPTNIMLVKDQEQLVGVKLIDFGLAFHTCEVVMGGYYQIPHYR